MSGAINARLSRQPRKGNGLRLLEEALRARYERRISRNR